ncbi:3D domain-containing protein [Delftia acidovorans]|uniref:3D domain-containing protein n=1 Tax=Delftia acidovorans TaxID=80866 RepID=UPI0028A79056|nr:3D domain-containing protein [Delftia acidovorans]
MAMQGRYLGTIAFACVCAHAGQSPTDFSFPTPAANGAKGHQLWATHYFVHVAPSVSSGIAFTDSAGNAVSEKVSPRDWCLAAIEGTVQVTVNGQPRTLNYGGTGKKLVVDCAATLKINPSKKPWITSIGKSYFTEAKGQYGDGVKGYQLVPLRTIAVDRRTIPYGTVIFIPQARGAEIALPSGEFAKHDGYFFAADTGGAIKGHHIDFFCGVTESNCLPTLIGNDEKKTFDAVEVTDSAIIEKLRAIHNE